MVVLEAVAIGSAISILVLLIVAAYKRDPSLFEATPPKVVQRIVEAFSPAPPAPDLEFPASLTAAITQLITDKLDMCVQMNHSCDTCKKKGTQQPQGWWSCGFDTEITTLIEQREQFFKEAIETTNEQMAALEQRLGVLEPKIDEAIQTFDQMQWAKRRFWMALWIAIGTALISNVSLIVTFIRASLGV